MRFLQLAVFFVGIVSFAQSKVGVVDIDFIITQLPEMEEVRDKMQNYADQLDVDFNKKLGEYNELRDAYEVEKENLSQESLREKQRELIEKENDIQKYQQNGAKLMEIKQQEYLQPLYRKVGIALDKVAAREKFTMVQEIGQSVVYLDSEYNLTIPVLNELGIEISEEDLQE